MKIVYIEESDSVIIHAGLPLEDYREPIAGEYVEKHNAVVHSDQDGKLRSIEILSGASKLFDLHALADLGLVEFDRGKGMNIEEFRQWREKLIEERRARAKTGRN